MIPGPAGTESRCPPTTTFLSTVAAPARRDHVVLAAGDRARVDDNPDGRVLTGLVQVEQLLAQPEVRANGGDRVVRLRTARDHVRAARRVALVEENHSHRSGLKRLVQLLDERARATLDQRDRALGLGRVVLRLAARVRRVGRRARDHDVVGGHHRRLHVARARERERDEVDGGIVVVGLRSRNVRDLVGARLLEDRGRVLLPRREVERLEAHAVTGLVKSVGHVLDGRVVPNGRRRAIALMGVGDPLELPLVLEDSIQRYCPAQLLRFVEGVGRGRRGDREQRREHAGKQVTDLHPCSLSSCGHAF